MGASMMTLMASAYDPTGQHATNALAWPISPSRATWPACRRMSSPPMKLDPLRDEGLAYLRALQRAGVNATGHTFNGARSRR